ncbi:MAG: transglutaminase-like domain-containing protein [Bacteroidota bacterium]
MCFHTFAMGSSFARYESGVIVHDCVVPSARPVVGTTNSLYEIDVREFLTSEKNAVVKQVLRRDMRRMLDDASRIPAEAPLFGVYRSAWEFFQSSDQGSFDFRARAVQQFVAQAVRYRRDPRRDTWQFPDETLRLGRGDCEDIAFLVASLLLGSGISGYNIRVCLGTVEMSTPRSRKSFDHMWVMYKDEQGQWNVIEPLSLSATGEASQKTKAPGKGAAAAPILSYIPEFGFNVDHLWQYGTAQKASFQERAELRKEWVRFEPRFAGFVHQSLIHDALAARAAAHPLLLNLLNQEFTVFLGDPANTVAEIDLPWKYHPFDHFDNGYISESWSRARQRLERCMDPANREMVRDFSRAAHAIADYYAHTSYAHFAQRDAQGALLLAKDDLWSDTALARWPDYSNGSDFPINDFRPATPWQGRDSQRVAVWNGALLSGRWRLPGDFGTPPEASLWATEQRDRRMRYRMALPHHDEIAVDKPSANGGSNGLYDSATFDAQYTLRYDAAVRHVRWAFAHYGSELEKLG